jgi:hypothetical protein
MTQPRLRFVKSLLFVRSYTSEVNDAMKIIEGPSGGREYIRADGVQE